MVLGVERFARITMQKKEKDFGNDELLCTNVGRVLNPAYV
jgi:hypothetical protein